LELFSDDVLKIYGEGASIRDIAREIGVHYSAVHRFLAKEMNK
jgi:transposase